MIDELDKLKEAWIVASEGSGNYSFDAIRKMVKKRSRNELLNIRRKFIVEWAVSVLLSICFVLYVHSIDPSKTLISVIYIALVLGISLIPYLKIMRFSFRQNEDLKTHLKLFINQFDQLVAQYIKMYVFLIPIAIFGAYMLGFVIGVNRGVETYQFQISDVIIGLTIMGLMSLFGYLILKRYFNWIYGKNIRRLKKCLSELEEVDD